MPVPRFPALRSGKSLSSTIIRTTEPATWWKISSTVIPRFRYLFEGHPGKSYALNSGIREARGDVLAFLDDDVIVALWLHDLTAPLAESQWAGSVGKRFCSGHRLFPSGSPWMVPTTPRLSRFRPGLYGQGTRRPCLRREHGLSKSDFREVRGLSNRSRSQHERQSPYSRRRHRNRPSRTVRRRCGERLRYEPSAVVYHPIPADRICKDRLLKWWFDQGRSDARQSPIRPLREFAGICTGSLHWAMAIAPARAFTTNWSSGRRPDASLSFIVWCNARGEPQRQSADLS